MTQPTDERMEALLARLNASPAERARLTLEELDEVLRYLLAKRETERLNRE